MRIGFDLRPFLKHETGVGVYLRNLLFELARIDAENEYFLFSASWKDRFPESRVPPFKNGRFRDFRWPVKAVNFCWQRLGGPTLDAIFRERLDITHSPSPLALPTKGKRVVTVCDLFFMEFPEEADREARRIFYKKAEQSLRRADGIIAISEFTKNALQERFGLGEDRIRVTHLGLGDIYRKKTGGGSVEAARRSFGLPPRFLLFVGASEKRKNLPALIDALAVLRDRNKLFPLVIVGRHGGDHARLVGRIKEHGLASSVRILGYLPEADVRSLYGAASAFVFPSSCEGFGLPLLEAMAVGLPVAASNVAAIPEIAGEAALYFDPRDPEDIAEKLVRVLEDDELRRSSKTRGLERVSGFTWEKTAALTLDYYKSLVGNR